jgi:hypothetical protein
MKSSVEATADVRTLGHVTKWHVGVHGPSLLSCCCCCCCCSRSQAGVLAQQGDTARIQPPALTGKHPGSSRVTAAATWYQQQQQQNVASSCRIMLARAEAEAPTSY